MLGLPVLRPGSTLMVLSAKFATARSGIPSPLKSPTTTPCGSSPTVKAVCDPKVPSPTPSRTLTVPGLEPELVTAKSSTPMLLKSPIATVSGINPTAYWACV